MHICNLNFFPLLKVTYVTQVIQFLTFPTFLTNLTCNTFLTFPTCQTTYFLSDNLPKISINSLPILFHYFVLQHINPNSKTFIFLFSKSTFKIHLKKFYLFFFPLTKLIIFKIKPRIVSNFTYTLTLKLNSNRFFVSKLS